MVSLFVEHMFDLILYVHGFYINVFVGFAMIVLVVRKHMTL